MHELLYSFAIERLHQDKTSQIHFYACLLNNNVRYFEMNYKFKHFLVSFFSETNSAELKNSKCKM